MSNNINATVFTGGRDPRNEISHGFKQIGNKVLEIIWVHTKQKLLNLHPGLLFRLLKCDSRRRISLSASCLAGRVKLRLFLASLLARFPLAIEPNGLLIERFWLLKRLVRLNTDLCERPSSLVLDEPPSFGTIDRRKANDLIKAKSSIFVKACLIFGQCYGSSNPLKRVTSLEALRKLH